MNPPETSKDFQQNEINLKIEENSVENEISTSKILDIPIILSNEKIISPEENNIESKNEEKSLNMSLTTKLRRLRKKTPEGWDLIEPTLEEFEAKMREAETEPHEGKRKTETVWPIFSNSSSTITLHIRFVLQRGENFT